MSWPSFRTEALPWEPRGEMSRRARAKAPTEYEGALAPFIADEPVELPSEVQTEVERATIAVARFDATHAHRLNTFTPLLLRTESVASSRIENLTSSARKVLEGELTGTLRGNAGLIVGNVRLMQAAKKLTTINSGSILAIHRILLEESAPRLAGALRSEPVWIGGSDLYPLDADYIAPHHRHLPDLVDDFVQFCNRGDIPALVHAAISHAHFENIHPFADGNGRTGRALIHVLLRQRGLTEYTSLPLSAALLTDVEKYFGALAAYRSGEIVPVVRLFAAAAIDAAQRGEWLAGELDSIRSEWLEHVTARADAADWRTLDVLLRQPIVTAQDLAVELGITPAAARSTLNRLEANEIVIGAQLPNKVRGWRAQDVLDALDQFGEGMRRSAGF